MENLNNNTASVEHDVTMLPVLLYTDSMKANEGFRLAVIRWKSMSDKPKLSPDRCVMVRKLHLTIEPSCLQTAFQQAFEDIQDAFIRECIESDIRNGKAPQPIAQSQLSASSIAEWNSQKSSGERLTKDAIEAWYQQDLHELLVIALAESKGFNEDNPPSDQVLADCEVSAKKHRDLLSKLASPTFTIGNPVVMKQLQNAVALSSDTTVGAKLATRLANIAKAQNEMDSLI